jgi:hypothetical protein
MQAGVNSVIEHQAGTAGANVYHARRYPQYPGDAGGGLHKHQFDVERMGERGARQLDKQAVAADVPDVCAQQAVRPGIHQHHGVGSLPFAPAMFHICGNSGWRYRRLDNAADEALCRGTSKVLNQSWQELASYAVSHDKFLKKWLIFVSRCCGLVTNTERPDDDLPSSADAARTVSTRRSAPRQRTTRPNPDMLKRVAPVTMSATHSS